MGTIFGQNIPMTSVSPFSESPNSRLVLILNMSFRVRAIDPIDKGFRSGSKGLGRRMATNYSRAYAAPMSNIPVMLFSTAAEEKDKKERSQSRLKWYVLLNVLLIVGIGYISWRVDPSFLYYAVLPVVLIVGLTSSFKE